MTDDILKRFYGEKLGQDLEIQEEVDQYMLLHNYIDKYQEKLGLYGTKAKKTTVEKVLAFTHKDLVRKANEVYLDFESFKKAKSDLQSNNSVKSTLRENCEKRGFPKSLVDKIAPTEISMRAIKQAVTNNAKVRQ